MRTLTNATATALAAASVAIALALAGASPAGAAASNPDEAGPNFAVPADLAPEAAKEYARALDLYEAAHHAEDGQTEKLTAAVKAMRKVRELAPRLAPACYYLGILYQETHEYEKARGILKTACDLNPAFHQAVVELGDTYCWLKQTEKAIPEYDRAIAMAPDYVHAYAMRGHAKLRAGDFKGALEDFDLGKRVVAAARKKAKAAAAAAAAGAKGVTQTASPAGVTKTATTVRGSEEPGPSGDPWIDDGWRRAKREVDGPGWAKTFVCETEHYHVMTPVSQEFADDLGKHAELIFKTYTKIFPKVGKEKRKFPVVVYGSPEDYHAAGGPQMAAGHYDPLIRKLVFYKNPKGDADTKIVLYHEGFHQFLHDYLERAPQWFNEGLGDFFGPSKYVEPPKGQRLGGMKLCPNPWRLKLIQTAIQQNRYRGFRQLMLMSQAELYDPQWIGIHYAESWSIIYFLVRGGAKPADEAGPYFKLLGDYFKALRKGDGQESAFEAAFGKVDLPKLEQEWRQFTLRLTPEG